MGKTDVDSLSRLKDPAESQVLRDRKRAPPSATTCVSRSLSLPVRGAN